MSRVMGTSLQRRGRQSNNGGDNSAIEPVVADDNSSHGVSQQALLGSNVQENNNRNGGNNEDDGSNDGNMRRGDKCFKVVPKRTRWGRIRAEFVAGALWVFFTLWILFASRIRALQMSMPWWWVSAFPSDGNRLFLVMLALVMGVWDLFTFARGTMLNPVVTVSQAVAGRLSFGDAFACIVAQFAATTFGAAAVRASARVIFTGKSVMGGDEVSSAFAPPIPHPEAHWMTAAAAEAASTAALCVLTLSMRGGEQHPVARFRRWLISVFVVLSSIAASSEWSGACMNPALALALTLLNRSWADHHFFVYWLSPLAGALAAAAFHVTVVDRYFPHDPDVSATSSVY